MVSQARNTPKFCLRLSVSLYPQAAKLRRFNCPPPLEIKMWRLLFLFFYSPFLMCRRVTASNEVDICNLGVLLGRKKNRGRGRGKDPVVLQVSEGSGVLGLKPGRNRDGKPRLAPRARRPCFGHWSQPRAGRGPSPGALSAPLPAPPHSLYVRADFPQTSLL